MKKFLIIVAILAAVAGALALWLKATTPSTSAGIRLPLSAAQRELLASVPATAESFALIPTAAVFRAKLVANPITRRPMMEWADTQQLPRAWMIGGADLVVWRAGKRTSYAVHLDPIRAALVRLYVMAGAGVDAQVDGGTFLINAGAGQPLGVAALDQLLSPAVGFEPGDALIIQQRSSRSTFPPIGRPAVTVVRIGATDIELHSIAAATATPETSPAAAAPAILRPRFPVHALVAGTFTQPPRLISDLDRLFIARISHLLVNGGSIALYDVNAGTLLPRPDGVIVAKATAENRETVANIAGTIRSFGEMKDTGEEIVLSLDRDSMGIYSTDTFIDARWPSNDWAARLDPKRAVPLLQKLGDNTGLRLAAPRIYRSARDLRRWIEYLSAADSVEASHSLAGATEELRVRIASK